jgi:hypothetical protein
MSCRQFNHARCLDEIGIEHKLKLGEVQLPSALHSKPVFFDHSWIEIDGKVLDNAIAFPLEPSLWHAPVILGHHVDDCRKTALTYGAISGLPLDLQTQAVQVMAFAAYMDGWPEDSNGLWVVASRLLRGVGKDFSAIKLRQRHT